MQDLISKKKHYYNFSRERQNFPGGGAKNTICLKTWIIALPLVPTPTCERTKENLKFLLFEFRINKYCYPWPKTLVSILKPTTSRLSSRRMKWSQGKPFQFLIKPFNFKNLKLVVFRVAEWENNTKFCKNNNFPKI